MQKFLKMATISLAVMSLTVLTGCTHTIHGAGQDIQNMGNAVSPPPKKVVRHHHKKRVKKTTTTTTTTTDDSSKGTTNMSGLPTSNKTDTSTSTTTSTSNSSD